MPVIDVYRAKMSYEVAGEGPVVVLVHGEDGNNLAWFQQIPFFARYFRTITVNLRSFAGSPCAAEDYHPKHFPDDMLALLDAEQIERAAFVCHSLGAWAGLPLATRHPERVSCLAISDSPTPAYSPGNWLVLQRALQIAAGLTRGELSDITQMGFTDEFERRRPDLVHLYFRLNELNGPRDLATTAAEELRLYPKDLLKYQTPTLVTGGGRDRFLTAENHKHVANLIPGAESHTFTEAGHSAYFEMPGEYNRVVGTYLARNLLNRT